MMNRREVVLPQAGSFPVFLPYRQSPAKILGLQLLEGTKKKNMLIFVVPSVTFLAFTENFSLGPCQIGGRPSSKFELMDSFFSSQTSDRFGFRTFCSEKPGRFLDKTSEGFLEAFFPVIQLHRDRVWLGPHPNPSRISDSPPSTPGLNRVGQRSNTLRSRSKVMLSSILPSVEFAAGQKKLRWKLRP